MRARKPSKFGLLITMMALLMAFVMPSPSLAEEGELAVMLYDMSGRMVGSATLSDSEAGLQIETTVAGMEPLAGDRATMFHETAVCGVGDSFGADYGAVVQRLPNLQFYADGSGEYAVVAEGWTTADLMDSDGSAYVIHADGGADVGPPIICGVIPAGAPQVEVLPAEEETPATPDEDAVVSEVDEAPEVPAAPMPIFTEYEVTLRDMSGREVGTAMLSNDGNDLSIQTMIAGMDPVPGDRATMFHEVGICGTGGNFGADYGAVVQLLPNLQFYANGSAEYNVVADDWNVADLMDSDGTAYVIHAAAGDEVGPPIACGVIPAGAGPAPAPVDVDGGDDGSTSDEIDPYELSDEVYLALLVETGLVGDMINRDGEVIGSVSAFFLEGEMELSIFMIDLDPAEPYRRVAITSQGTCNAPSFDRSGEELIVMPYELEVWEDGYGDYFDYLEEVGSSEQFLDEDGSAVVVYESYGDDPGEIVACGSLESMTDWLADYGITVEEYIEYILGILW